ncbi:MAG: o-succinylbenzoate--CoA ligase [Myxococcota bacterium]
MSVWMKENARIPCPLAEAAERFGEAIALFDGKTRWSFLDWHHAAEGMCAHLDDTAGPVGIIDPNHLSAAAMMFAVWRTGRSVALISHRTPDAQINVLRARLGLTQVFHGHELRVERMEAARLQRTVTGGIGTILMTSGSSGSPKAVAHTLSAHLANAEGSNQNIIFQPGDVWLRSLSFHHVGGLALIFRALRGGGAIGFGDTDADLAAACRNLGVTHLSVVAVQLQRLLRSETTGLRLRAVLVGGGPVPEALVDEALQRGMPIHTTYGMTEMGSQVATTPPNATRPILRTAGRPLPGRALTLSPEGEIRVRGEPLMAGYLQDDGRLEPGTDAEGWYHTGDIGTLDEDGFLTVVGRRDLMFISGGENIFPEEIERALMAVPGVEAAVVVAVPDETWGARPVAFIRSPSPIDPTMFHVELSGRLARFKVPDRFLAWPDDAPGWSGKPPRRWFTERARALG